jgi:hypothetical protein
MNVADRVEITRAACQAAIASPPLADVEAFLERLGVPVTACIRLLRDCAVIQAPTPELTRLDDAIRTERVAESEPSAFARALLVRASLAALDQLPAFPVDDSVKHLFCKEFLFYASPSPPAFGRFAITAYPFIAMSKFALLDRFPGGQQDWEVSGFPRKWLVTITRQAPRFLTEREYFKSFYRMASAIEMQPSVKAIMGPSWLHSLETHRISPHLAFLNRPHLDAGGIYIDIGPAPPNAGFLAGDKQREELYSVW